MEQDPELSLLLARHSIRTTYQRDKIVLPLSNSVLREAIIKSKVELTLRSNTDGVGTADWSPDGKRIVTASDDKMAKVWDASTGQELFTLTGHQHGVTAATWSPNGLKVATASRDMVTKVWSTKTGQEVLTLNGHDNWVTAVDWSPDGKWIATGSRDETAKVWDAMTGRELITLNGHENRVTSVNWSPNGKNVATAGSKITQIYTTDIDELLQIAESRVSRQLKAEEKEKYGVLD